MSKTIDEKVVEMRFDNKDFEKNVSKSMKTIDELKFKLQTMDFRNNVKGLDDIGKAAKDLDMSSLSNGLEVVRAKFSALQIIGITALQNITNSAINAGKQIANSLTNSLIEGGKQRALKIKDAKFQMEGLLGTEEFAKQWDRIDESINYAVKDTAYGYDSAARAASQFLASNVKVGDEMDRSLRAISGVAAMTNSTYDDISNIFTRVAGQGRIMAIDLNSLAARGLNAAAVLGKSMGKTESEIRDMVSKGKVSFADFSKAMDEAFGEHAKKGNETFSGALANMKAAMSRIGAKIFDPLLDNERDVFNQMRLLINDLNNNYLDAPIKTLNSKLTEIFQSIVKFFELGGMKNIILGIANVFKFLYSIIKPIHDVFREIFPKKSVETLVEYTNKFRELTERIKLSEETTNNIKNIFRGLFSIISTGINILKRFGEAIGKILSNLTGIPGGILGVLGAFGNWITTISDTVKKSTLFNDVLNDMVDLFSRIINKLKEFIKKFDIFSTISKVISGIYNIIKDVFGYIMSKTTNVQSLFKTMNTGIFGLILLSINNITKSLDLFFRKVEKFNSVGNIGQILATVKNNLYEMQFNIKADTIMKIAKALALLAASLWVLATIDPEALGRALGGMTALIIELMAALKVFLKIIGNDKVGKNIIKGSIALELLASALLILGFALKILSTIGLKEMGIALLGIAGGLTTMLIALRLLPKKDIRKATTALKSMATALLILSVALKILSTIGLKEMGIALLGIAGGLTAMVGALLLLRFAKGSLKSAVSMLILANSMLLLAGVLKILVTMSWDDIKRGLTVMGGALAELTAALLLLSLAKGSLKNSISTLIIVNSMLLLAGVLKILATMSWDDIKRGLTVMGGALAELTAALLLLSLAKGSLKNSVSILIMANSMLVLASVLKILATISVGNIAKGLITIALALGIFGGAAALLGPLVPVMIGLSIAIGLLGVSLIALGAGLTLVGTGIGTLVAQFIGNIDLILISLKGLIVGFVKMIPDIIIAAKDIILALCEVLIETAPAITKAFLTILLETIKQLDKYVSPIVSILFDFLLKVIDELINRMPELIKGIIKLVEAIFKGFKEAIETLDPSALASLVESAKTLSIVFIILAGLSKVFPAAALGVAEFGVLVAELGAVMVALGGLSKIPGINNLISDGGSMLENIGIGIGKFVGAIVSGIANAMLDLLPKTAEKLSEFMENLGPFLNGINSVDGNVAKNAEHLAFAILAISASEIVAGIASFISNASGFGQMGSNLSTFITNAKPFFDGVSQISPETLQGVLTLSKAILALTAGELLQGITKFIGGSEVDLSKFSSQLAGLADGINTFAEKVKDIDSKAVEKVKAACEAIIAIADVNSKIPNSGGWLANIVGDNKIDVFGEVMPKLGEGLNGFVNALNGFNDSKLPIVTAACEAIKKIAETNNSIPNTGGLISKIIGDNDIGTFGEKIASLGEGLNSFVTKLSNFTTESQPIVNAACDAIKKIADLGNSIGDSGWYSKLIGDSDLEKFSSSIPSLGEGINGFVAKLTDFSSEKVAVVASACTAITNISSLGALDLTTLGGNLKDFGYSLTMFGSDIYSFTSTLEEVGLDTIEACIGKVNSLITMANTIASVSVESLSTFSTSLVQVATDGVNNFCLAFSGPEPVEQVKQAIIILIDALITSIDSKKQDIYNKFIELMNKALEAMRNKKTEFVNVTIELCNAVLDTFSNYYDAMYQVGCDFTMGFVEGMRSKIEEAARAAAEMARAALQAAKAAIDSNSPSKETMALGGFFGEGFMLGIKSYSRKVYNEAYDVGDTAKEGLSRAISKISSIIDNGIETSPTIRPVLDLSNLESGVSRIDSMFNNGTVALNGNVDSISNNFKLRSQNGLNSSVEEAINNLSNKLQGLSGNTLNIYTQELDSNKLDQIVVYVDRQLGIKYLVK